MKSLFAPLRAVVLVLALAACVVAIRVATPQDAKEDIAPELREKIDRISRDVARLRGLKFERPVPLCLITPKEAADFARRELEEEDPDASFEPRTRAFKTLGLLPEDFKLKEELISLLEVQAGGFYDPESGKMLLVNRDLGKALTGMVLSHELTHALDDQHFNLKKIIEDRARTLDYEFALTGLLEGDATEIMKRYILDQDVNPFEVLGEASTPEMAESNRKLANAPAFLRNYLLSRYIYGMGFVGHFVEQGGWARVDEIYRDLPLSSEQVMHPAKYYPRRDFPTRIDLPDVSKALASDGWKLTEPTTLGEINVLALVESWAELLKEPKLIDSAGEIAAGWDGDLLARFEKGDESVTVWISTWDTPDDAAEFRAAFAKWVTHWEAGETNKDCRRAAVCEQPRRDDKPGLDVVCVLARTRGKRPEWVDAIQTDYRKTVARTVDELEIRN